MRQDLLQPLLIHPIVLVLFIIQRAWLTPWQAIGVSFLLAAALRYGVEQPLRRGKPFGLRRPTPVPA